VLGLATLVATLLRFRARAYVGLACLAAMLCMATNASASPGVQPKTRVWDFELAAPLNIRLHALTSSRQHPAISPSQLELAPGSPLAARGAGAITAETSVLARASNAAFSATGRAEQFTVGAKHLAGAGGGWAKFAAGTNPNALLAEALSSPGAGFYANDAASFRVVTDLGRVIGTKGETAVRAVVDFGGNVVTWFPVRP
jgi:hypothetical protein